jgi:hypothetical protein
MANEFKRMQKLAGIITESKLNENKPYALLATVADDWGKDSDIYGDLEAAVVGWTDRNGELSPKGKIAIKNLLSNWDLLDDYGFFIDNDEMNEDENKFPFFDEWKKDIIHYINFNHDLIQTVFS